MGLLYHNAPGKTTVKSIKPSKIRLLMPKNPKKKCIYAVYTLDLCKTPSYNSNVLRPEAGKQEIPYK